MAMSMDFKEYAPGTKKGRAQFVAQPLFTFLPFYFFTFKSPLFYLLNTSPSLT